MKNVRSTHGTRKRILMSLEKHYIQIATHALKSFFSKLTLNTCSGKDMFLKHPFYEFFFFHICKTYINQLR